MYIDTHCHLDSRSCENIEEILKLIGDNIVITSGYDGKANKEIIELCNKYNNVYGTLGIHPSDIKENIEEDLTFIEENITNPKIVGIGEIGLDYHYDDDTPKGIQKKYFIKQIELAIKYNKTIVIHSRDAAEDTYNILKEYKDKVKIDMHCYGYSLEMAKRFIDLGATLGIGGVLTFKNSHKLKEVVENISLDKFVLETDSPYLTPEPYRGKKNNPSYVVYVADKIAEIKGITRENVINETTNTALHQFDISK